MVRASASSSKKTNDEKEKQDKPEVLERKRLKKLAFSDGILLEIPAKTYSPLTPSKPLIKHHGRDILRKSQRKNRFLFSFPGLLAPIAGAGKIGDLKNLGTKNPILYLHFPQGQMKLFGTIVYPKNKYLTLQFSRSGKNVVCEDYFDNMIVFSDAWWIGTKEENPEEAKLDIPKELIKGQEGEYDFNGGAGDASIKNQVVHKHGTRFLEEDLPETELENDISEDEIDTKPLKEATPTRHSERTAGKSFKFAEVSSGDDSVESDVGIFSKEDKEVKIDTSCTVVVEVDNESFSKGNRCEQIPASAVPETKSKKLSKSSVPMETSKEHSHRNHGSLVQATISTLFKKVRETDKLGEKEAARYSTKLSSSKDSGNKMQHRKRNIDQVEGPRKGAKSTDRAKAGTRTKAKKKLISEDDDDDIEEFLSSSSSQDTIRSDEDWAA